MFRGDDREDVHSELNWSIRKCSGNDLFRGKLWLLIDGVAEPMRIWQESVQRSGDLGKLAIGEGATSEEHEKFGGLGRLSCPAHLAVPSVVPAPVQHLVSRTR